MRRIDEQEWLALQRALAQAMATAVPAWTENQQHDPGITILQVIAYFTEELSTRGPLPQGGALWASRIVDALSGLDSAAPVDVHVDGERWNFVRSLADASQDARVFSVDDDGTVRFGDGEHGRRPPPGSRIAAGFTHGIGSEGNSAVAVRTTWPFSGRLFTIALGKDGGIGFGAAAIACESWSGLKRPRYFDARLLTANDFADEQSYLLTKHRRHQNALHGSGIVQGLHVEGTDTGDTVTVRAGFALDAQGREIYLSGDVLLTVPAGTLSPACVVLEYVERETDAVPSSAEGEPVMSRIEEGSRVLLTNGGSGDGVPIARLIGAENRWKLDASFVPPRIR